MQQYKLLMIKELTFQHKKVLEEYLKGDKKYLEDLKLIENLRAKDKKLFDDNFTTQIFNCMNKSWERSIEFFKSCRCFRIAFSFS